jgi:ubiquinone/menaquinone biosynthesis C-methylase UbiE
MTVGQRFARAVTTVVVRVPLLWRVFRSPMARMFDRIAPQWEGGRTSGVRLAPMLAALDALPTPPARVLDVGTGTGAVARAVAARFSDAEVVGVDVSGGMIAEARRLASGPLERYEVADASALAFDDGSFDLVTLNNMIPFFDELARVTRRGGHVAVAFGIGPRTPIFVPLERVRAELERRGFEHVGEYAAGEGQSLLARRAESA